VEVECDGFVADYEVGLVGVGDCSRTCAESLLRTFMTESIEAASSKPSVAENIHPNLRT